MKIQDSNEDQITQMLAICRFLAMAFPAISFLQYAIVRIDSTALLYYLHYSVVLTGTMAIMFLIYAVWIILHRKSTGKVQGVIDAVIPLMTILVSILLTGANKSNYKFLLLFVVISSSIEYSAKISRIIAVVVSVAVLMIDLAFGAATSNGSILETDLLLISVFLTIAWIISFYVDVRRQHIERLQGLADLDSLTKLNNHRRFYERLEQLLSQGQNPGDVQPVSLLFADVDNFKYYNDLCGHQLGDEALCTISDIMREHFEAPNFVARYGGEEFAVLLPNTDETRAVEMAEKLRLAVRNYAFPNEKLLPGQSLTISIGVSSFPKRAKTALEFVKNADEACYRAKFLCKNRVETYRFALEEMRSDEQKLSPETVASVKTLIAVINAKDRYTYGHVERVVFYCTLFAEKAGLSVEEKSKLIMAAYLHDIGKIDIAKEILLKTDKLDDTEWETLKSHPQKAEEIIQNIPVLKKLTPIVLQHHEKYDGSGYPDGLRGEEICYLARVLTVIDSFDAMTSNRPYQPRKTYPQAMEELKRCSGTQFDPIAVSQFLDAIEPMVMLNMDSHVDLSFANIG